MKTQSADPPIGGPGLRRRSVRGHASAGRALLAVLLLAACLPAAAHASSGVWDRAWGKGVNGGTGPEICTVAPSCQFGQGSGLGGAVFPQDVATDPAGNVYVVEYADQRVQKFDAQGHFLLAWGKNVDAVSPSTGFEICTVSANCKAGETGTFGGEFNLPIGIATDGAGNVYVADRFNDRIQEFTSGGAFIRAFGQDVSSSKSGNIETCDIASDCKAGTAIGSIGGVLFFPADVAVGPDGRVYVANGLRRVEAFKPDFTFDRAWGAEVVSVGGGYEVCTVATQCRTGSGGNGFDHGGEVALPVSVATSQAGDVYVFEGNRFRVERFTADGGFGLAWGKDVDAANAGTGFEVCTVAANCKTGVTGSESGAFRSPNDVVAPASDSVAVDPTGTVYVADRENDRVQAFSAGGGFTSTWGLNVDPTNGTIGYEICTATCTSGSEDPVGGSLLKPTGIAASATGDVYTADQVGQRIQKFTCGTSTVTFPAATATVAEAAGTLHLSVQRTGDTGCAASVHYATANGTALAGSDFSNRSGTLTFAVGQTTATIDVPITPDTAHEGDETFSVTLSAPVSPATIGAPATSTVTITDDDLIDTAITSGPAGGTKDTTPTFTFTADPPAGATFECALDQGAFAACAATYTTAPLADGPHRLRVRAIGPAPAHDTDSSPAVRDFTVDTVAPGTVIQLVPASAESRAISSTAFSGTVRATADEQDPPPGVGNGVTRCVLDPPVPPAAYDDLPVGTCPSPTTAALGTHTFYAASLDQVFNIGPVVSVTFKVLAAPDTQILGGPTGTTWRRDPEFTLTSTIGGSTFRCRVDAYSFSPCTTPYRTYPLSFGTHTISVVAVSPEGAEDPTPATRTFTVAKAETHDADCRVQPFPTPEGQSRIGCGWGPRCPGRVSCGAALPTCPSAAVCTISLNADFATPSDTFMQVNLGDANHNRFGIWEVQTWTGFARSSSCGLSLLGGNTKSCSAFASRSFLGQDLPITTYCAANAYDSLRGKLTPFPGDFGGEGLRSLACAARIKIAPASALEAVAAGTGFALYAPVPGRAYVAGDIPPIHRATVARRVTAFRTTLRARATKAGPLRFTPKLTRTAARILQRRHELRVTLRVRFKPRSGKTIIQTRRVTLTQLANPRAEAIAKLRAYCLKHRELKRLQACKRALR